MNYAVREVGGETFIQENPNKKCIGKLYVNDSVREVGGGPFMQENTNNKLHKNVQENSTVYELPSTSSRGVETFIQENPNKKCIGKLYIYK